MIIYGNGSMAKVMHGYIRPVAFTVDRKLIKGNGASFLGKPMIPFDEIGREFPPETYREILVAVGFNDMNRVRAYVTDEVWVKGYTPRGFIHPSALFAGDVKIGQGTVLLDCVTLHPDCRIGDGVWMTGHNAIGHDCEVGNYCWLNSGVTLAGHVKVGWGTVFGINSAVADHVTIGKRCYIGAGTLVASDVPDDTVVVGERGQKFPMTSRNFLEFMKP